MSWRWFNLHTKTRYVQKKLLSLTAKKSRYTHLRFLGSDFLFGICFSRYRNKVNWTCVAKDEL